MLYEWSDLPPIKFITDIECDGSSLPPGSVPRCYIGCDGGVIIEVSAQDGQNCSIAKYSELQSANCRFMSQWHCCLGMGP